MMEQQSAKRMQTPDILEAGELRRLFDELSHREQAMVLLDSWKLRTDGVLIRGCVGERRTAARTTSKAYRYTSIGPALRDRTRRERCALDAVRVGLRQGLAKAAGSGFGDISI